MYTFDFSACCYIFQLLLSWKLHLSYAAWALWLPIKTLFQTALTLEAAFHCFSFSGRTSADANDISIDAYPADHSRSLIPSRERFEGLANVTRKPQWNYGRNCEGLEYFTCWSMGQEYHRSASSLLLSEAQSYWTVLSSVERLRRGYGCSPSLSVEVSPWVL